MGPSLWGAGSRQGGGGERNVDLEVVVQWCRTSSDFFSEQCKLCVLILRVCTRKIIAFHKHKHC